MRQDKIGFDPHIRATQSKSTRSTDRIKFYLFSNIRVTCKKVATKILKFKNSLQRKS